jgi:hypothetical protein
MIAMMMMNFPRAFYLLQRSLAWCRLRHIGFIVALFGLVVLSNWDTGIPVVVVVSDDGPSSSDKSGPDSSAAISSTPPSFSSTPPKFSDSLATVASGQQEPQQHDYRSAIAAHSAADIVPGRTSACAAV